MDLNNLNRSFSVLQFKFSSKDRLKLWKRLGKFLRDGIPIVTALEELKNLRKPSDPMAVALGEWVVAMKNGRRLYEAVKDWVTPEEAMLIMAGEQAGTLPEAMNSVVVVTSAKKAVQSAIKGGLAYPFFLILMAFGVLYLFNFKIIPTFTAVVPNAKWTGMAKIMIVFGDFVQMWLPWMAASVVALIIATFASLGRWSGPSRTAFDRYPPFSIYRMMQGSSWVIALSALIKAGVPVVSALEQLAQGASPWARVRIEAALRGLRSGKDLGDALHHSGYEFPDREIIGDLRVYATKSGFDEALRIIGNEWITESVEQIESLMRMVFSAVLLVAAGIIAFEVSGLMALQLQMANFMKG